MRRDNVIKTVQLSPNGSFRKLPDMVTEASISKPLAWVLICSLFSLAYTFGAAIALVSLTLIEGKFPL